MKNVTYKLSSWALLDLYYPKNDLKAIANLDSQFIRAIMGNVIIRAAYGNNNDCSDFLYNKKKDKYIIYYCNHNGEFITEFSDEEIQDIFRDKSVNFEFNVTKYK